METSVLILQIITIVVSICSLIFNLLSSARENSKKNYIKVVTEQRLKNKNILRDAVKQLLACSSKNALETLDNNALKQCEENEASISTVLKNIYPEDTAVLHAVKNLISELEIQLHSSNNERSVENARQILLDEFSIYDLADWRFIKKQANGKSIDSKDFDNIYREVREKYPLSKH